MPIPLVIQGAAKGISSIPYAWDVLHVAVRVVPWILVLGALKYYFGGARNTSERLMHSKRVMITVHTPLRYSRALKSGVLLTNHDLQ